MKFLYSKYLIILFLGLFTLPSICFSQFVNIVANPKISTLIVGQTATILINAEAGDQEVNSVQLIINFNKSELEIVGNMTTPSPMFTQVVINRVIDLPENDSKSQIQFSGAVGTNASITNTFEVFSIEVKALTTVDLSEFEYVLTNNPRTKVSFGSNSELLGTTETFGVTTTATNSIPTIMITNPADGIEIKRATEITFEATATDLEDDDSTLKITWEPDAVFVDENMGATVTTKLLQPGVQTITATVTDSNGATNNQSIMVTVSNPELAIDTPVSNALLNSKEVTFDLLPDGMDTSDHFHFAINPADPNNVTPAERFNTSGEPGQTMFTYGEAENIQEGENTVVITIATQFHQEFNNTRSILQFTVDSTPPEINLNGENPMELDLNEEYVEPGAIADDSNDGAITTIDIDNSNVDTSKSGNYEVTYNVVDSAGNSTTIFRTVTVSPTLHTDTLPEETKFLMFPNPADDYLFLQVGETSRLEQASIYTLDGKLLTTLKNTSDSNELQIDISNYARGLYLIIARVNDLNKFERILIK